MNDWTNFNRSVAVEEVENQTKPINISVSDEFVIWKINARESLKYLPGGLMLIILTIIGLIGNGLVIYVYKYHFKATTAYLFINVLAILDAVCCVFGMPFEIVIMFFPFLSAEPFSCKIFKTVERTAEVISGTMMLLIAYDRYLHICKPFKVFTYSRAKRLIYVAATTGTVVSLPALAIIGIHEKHIKGMELSECDIDPIVKGSNVALVYFVAFNIFFLCSMFALIGMYTRIWVVVYKWKRSFIGETSKIYSTETSKRIMPKRVNTTVENVTTNEEISTEINSKRPVGNRISNTSSTSHKLSHSISSMRRLQSLKRRNTLKPLIILFAVAVGFIVSFTPQFIISLLSAAHLTHRADMSLEQRQWWEVGYRSYFLSNVINPVIYATFDTRFRKKCFQLLIKRGHYDRPCCR